MLGFPALFNAGREQVLCLAAEKQYYPKGHCGHPLKNTFKNTLKALPKSCLRLLSVLLLP